MADGHPAAIPADLAAQWCDSKKVFLGTIEDALAALWPGTLLPGAVEKRTEAA